MYIQIQVTGHPGSGKTTFINQLRKDYSNPNFKKNILIPLYGKPVKFELIEDSITEKTSGHIVMLDLTDPNGLDKMEQILIRLLSIFQIHVIICGNKKDSDKRVLFPNEITKVIRKYPNILYLEISSKLGHQIHQPLSLMILSVVDTQHQLYQIFKEEYKRRGKFKPKILARSISIYPF